MKIPNWFKVAVAWLWAFIKKNFRWLLPVLFFTIWFFGFDKHYIDFIAGGVFACGVWYAWTHWLKSRIQK
jgi:hypothetical protein